MTELERIWARLMCLVDKLDDDADGDTQSEAWETRTTILAIVESSKDRVVKKIKGEPTL